jgi:hypothetical protein
MEEDPMGIRTMTTLTTLAAALMAAGAGGAAYAAPKPIVGNGGFERPAAPSSGGRGFPVGRVKRHWLLTEGMAGVVANWREPAQAGNQSALLSAGQPDDLTQPLDIPEGVYDLTFYARTDCPSASLQVKAGVFTFGESLTDTWTQFDELTETDDQPAPLEFSTDEATCNVYLDSVSVTAS